MVLIDIEVINAQLDYNLLLGCSYMYTMKFVASTVFQLLMFPHDGKIVNINQLTYYDPKGLTTLEHVLTMIDTTIDNVSIPSLSIVGLGLFTNSLLKDTYFSLAPPPSSNGISYLCTITSGNIPTSS